MVLAGDNFIMDDYHEQDGPSSGVKLDLKLGLSLNRSVDPDTLVIFVTWHPWHLFNPSTFATLALYS